MRKKYAETESRHTKAGSVSVFYRKLKPFSQNGYFMEIAIILLLIFLNGILSMSEIALISSRTSRLEAEARKGSRSARAAFRLATQPDRFLSTIQIGITLIGILTGLYSGERFAENVGALLAKIDFLRPHAVLIAKILIVTIVTYLTLVLGELVPKRIGMNASERVAKLVARPMHWLSVAATPFVWLLGHSTSGMLRLLGIRGRDREEATEEEIKAIIRKSAEGGEIEQVEQDIVERVFNLSDRDVDSIMTHRSDVVWLDIRDTGEAVNEKVTNHLYDMYPVADGTLDRVVGAVYLKDLFGRVNRPGFKLSDIVRPAQYLPENQSVYRALDKLRRERIKSGIVIDEYGTVKGIITLKDIVNAVLGAMPEAGEEPDLVRREDGTWLVDGQYSFYDFLEHFDMEYLYPEGNYATLSGLLLDLLERIPATGEKICWHRFEFEVVDMDGARIDKLLVRKLPEESRKEAEV